MIRCTVSPERWKPWARAIRATREDEVDNLLRAETFVDLFSVVRHGIRASESYSIKKLEPLYSFARTVPLEDVGGVLARTPTRLEMADYQRSVC
jgi:hypothetical protein